MVSRMKILAHIDSRGLTLDDYVESLPYHMIGEGSFGMVFQKGPNRVVKIGYVNSDNYLNYVNLVGLNSSNPNLPKFYSVKVFDPDPNSPYSHPFYVVEMERLLNWDNVAYIYGEDSITDYMKMRGLNDVYDLSLPFGSDDLNCKNLIGVRNILHTLLANGACPDLAPRNFMFRKSGNSFHIVVTDPVV